MTSADDAAGRGGGEAAPVPDGPMAEPPVHRAGRSVLVLVSVLVVYYAVPVGSLPSGGGIVASAVALLAGVAALAWLSVRQARRLNHAPAGGAVRLDSLIFLVYLVVPIFALGFFALERADPDQFADLETKTDALYFTVSTLATVGFGDVHATGQVARALVALQITFNLVVVASLASLLTTHLRERVAARRPGGEPRRGEP
ncbi:MAG TPA: potassium channel family protein [Acidimicrobiales bacterium]